MRGNIEVKTYPLSSAEASLLGPAAVTHDIDPVWPYSNILGVIYFNQERVTIYLAN